MSNLNRGLVRSKARTGPLRMAGLFALVAVIPLGSFSAQQSDVAPERNRDSAQQIQMQPETELGSDTDHFGPSGRGTADPTLGSAANASPLAASTPVSSTAAQGPMGPALTFLERGGPAIWAITLLSVVALALILWKIWRLALTGAWTGGRRCQKAVLMWSQGREREALYHLQGRRTCRAFLARTAMVARLDDTLDDAGARAETERVARMLIAQARAGLRPLELISTIAPLLGLLGTVMGMIAAFQALQGAGSRADPAILAGGIWEALLTTAAGMAVAIPASMALTWFESVVDRLRQEMEDAATRIFLRPLIQDTAEGHAPAHSRAAE